MKKVAVILSGCGVYDGSEIHEATLALLALSKNEVEYQCFAPDIDQHHVINHLTGEEMNEKRNVLVESARIARGDVKSLSVLDVKNFDGILLPGGFGAAKNLSTYAMEGESFSVNEELANVIREFHANKKPIAALCIAPVIIAKVLDARVTIGNDKETASHIVSNGGVHVNKDFNEIAIDEKNLVITNPCYMIADSIYKVSLGAEAAVAAMLGVMK